MRRSSIRLDQPSQRGYYHHQRYKDIILRHSALAKLHLAYMCWIFRLIDKRSTVLSECHQGAGLSDIAGIKQTLLTSTPSSFCKYSSHLSICMSDPQQGGISRQVSLVRAIPRVGPSIAYSLSEGLRKRATFEDVTHPQQRLEAPSELPRTWHMKKNKLNTHGGTCGLVETMRVADAVHWLRWHYGAASPS